MGACLRAVCVAFVWHRTLGAAWGVSADPAGLCLFLAGVVAGYALDRVVDEGTGRSVLAASAGVGLATVLAAPRLLVPAALLGGIAVAYSRLKRFVPKELLTAGAWTFAVCVLSFAEAPAIRDAWPLAACVFLLVLANAVVCDRGDWRADVAAGVRSLTVRVGPDAARLPAAAGALGASGLALAAGAWPLALPGAALAALAVGGADRRAWADAALCLPILSWGAG